MTDRDKKIIELVSQCGVITREQVQRVLFKDTHINVPLRRLKVLVDNKEIKRDYYNIGGHRNVFDSDSYGTEIQSFYINDSVVEEITSNNISKIKRTTVAGTTIVHGDNKNFDV